MDKSLEIIGQPIPFEMVGRRPGDPARLIASSDKAKKELGWSAKYSDVETLIESTWRVYKKNTGK